MSVKRALYESRKSIEKVLIIGVVFVLGVIGVMVMLLVLGGGQARGNLGRILILLLIITFAIAIISILSAKIIIPPRHVAVIQSRVTKQIVDIRPSGFHILNPTTSVKGLISQDVAVTQSKTIASGAGNIDITAPWMIAYIQNPFNISDLKKRNNVAHYSLTGQISLFVRGAIDEAIEFYFHGRDPHLLYLNQSLSFFQRDIHAIVTQKLEWTGIEILKFRLKSPTVPYEVARTLKGLATYGINHQHELNRANTKTEVQLMYTDAQAYAKGKNLRIENEALFDKASSAESLAKATFDRLLALQHVEATRHQGHPPIVSTFSGLYQPITRPASPFAQTESVRQDH